MPNHTIQRFRDRALASLLVLVLLPSLASAQATIEGIGNITTPGGDIPFNLKLFTPDAFFRGEELSGLAFVGVEQDPEARKGIPWRQNGKDFVIDFAHYGSEIRATWIERGELLSGVWVKDRGEAGEAILPFRAEFNDERELYPVPQTKYLGIGGDWLVQFEDSAQPVLLTARIKAEARFDANVVTDTGDYRYLKGVANREEFVFSTFDGAHAFLFRGRLTDMPAPNTMGRPSAMEGTFWSGNWYQTDFEGIRTSRYRRFPADRVATPTDVALGDLSYPDLDGVERALDDPELMGKVTIYEVFGSWCPNCGDAAALLEEFEAIYGDRGLNVVGLAFEVATDPAERVERIRAYLDRHNAEWPVLLVGPADKQRAAEAFPLLDKVHAYPTFIVVDHAGEIRWVYSGFDGPATGVYHNAFEERLRTLVIELLDEAEAAEQAGDGEGDGE